MVVPVDLHPDDAAVRDQLARRLRRIREGRNISQLQLADRLGIDSGNVAAMERRRQWKTATVQAWARTVGYRVDLRIDGLTIPDDGDPIAALYDAQQPTTETDEDRLDLRILVNNLARIRRDQGVTLAAMGARLGCSEGAVCRRETNPDGAMVATVQQYCRALGGALCLDLEPVWSTPASERTAV